MLMRNIVQCPVKSGIQMPQRKKIYATDQMNDERMPSKKRKMQKFGGGIKTKDKCKMQDVGMQEEKRSKRKGVGVKSLRQGINRAPPKFQRKHH